MSDADPAFEPENVELKDSQHTFVLRWADGKTTTVSYKDLRFACRCAGCVDEMSGAQRLQRDTIPDDIGIVHCETVGHYAIRFDWTDGHNTGIYTWERIRGLGAS
jgi:ATP-binding protein involved in chromosome partitioning